MLGSFRYGNIHAVGRKWVGLGQHGISANLDFLLFNVLSPLVLCCLMGYKQRVGGRVMDLGTCVWSNSFATSLIEPYALA